MMIEKRVYKRYESGDKLWAGTVLSEQVKIRHWIKNISMGGICLVTSHHMTHNDTFRIEIGRRNSGNNEKIMMTVLVAWSVLRKAVGEDFNGDYNIVPLYEVGLKFIDLDDSKRHYLDKLISELTH